MCWMILCAALLPIALKDIPKRLDRFLEHLQRGAKRRRLRSADTFLNLLAKTSGQSG